MQRLNDTRRVYARVWRCVHDRTYYRVSCLGYVRIQDRIAARVHDLVYARGAANVYRIAARTESTCNDL